MGSSFLNRGDRLLVVGGDSMIGAALTAALREAGYRVHSTTRRAERRAEDRPFLDLAQPDLGAPLPAGYRTAFLCAAVARLDDCFKNPQKAFAVNVANTTTLARQLAQRGTSLIFLSTNQVLSGHLHFPDETAPLAPSNVYGGQKAAVEQALWALAAETPDVAVTVLRLSKVLPPVPELFADWAATLGRGLAIHAAADMSLAPVPVDLVATALRRLAEERLSGLFQLSSTAEINYVDAAIHLCRHLKAPTTLVRQVQSVVAGFVCEPPPRHTLMDSGRLVAAIGVKPPAPYAVLDQVFAKLPGNATPCPPRQP